jgi:RHS repeat-associated protein
MKSLFSKLVLLAAFVLPIFVTIQALAQDTNGGAVFFQNYGRVPLRFEPNAGQADPQVRYISRGNGYAMYFTPTKIVLALDVSTNASESQRPFPLRKPPHHQFAPAYLEFENANRDTVISAEQTLPEKINYFIGNDPAQWRTGISAFGRIRYQNIYPGIDLAFYGNQSHLEYDFAVAPGANPKAIVLKLEGADNAAIEANGDLVFSVKGQRTYFRRPAVYQNIDGTRQDVAGSYRLKGNSISFEIGNYDKSQPLVIDPVLSYSTFLGGAGGVTLGLGIACDSSGDAYVGGETTAIFTNVWTQGAFQTNYAGGTYNGDAFIAKIGPTGTNLVYLTYLGGSGDDLALGISVDSAGNAFVAGGTLSTDFPTTNALYPTDPTPFSVEFGFQPASGFVAELNTNGSRLIYSTYLGGSNDTGTAETLIEDMTIDSSDNAYLTGWTFSSNFPVTIHAFQRHFPGTNYTIGLNYNGFLTEIASNDSSLVYSTYLGGTNADDGIGIAVDNSNYVYITGETASWNFPTDNVPTNLPSGQYINGVNNGNPGYLWDAFVTKFPPLTNQPSSITNLVYSFFLGGSENDYGYGIAADTNGNAYVVGYTYSLNFPTNNGLDCSLNSGNGNTSISDAFVTKLAASGEVLYSTYLGGSNTDIAYAVAAQNDGEAVIVGETGSTDFAPYVNYGSINSGDFDAFVAKLNSSGNALENFAYLGGSSQDAAYAVALDAQDNVYITGNTASPNFPVTTNVFDPNFGATYYSNAFVAKLYFEPDQLGTEVITSWQNTNDWSVGGVATLAASNTWSGISQIASVSSNDVTSLSNTRFQRGISYDPTFTSFVIPVSQQTGFRLDDFGNNSENFGGSYPWFTRLQCDTRTHLSLISSTNVAGVSTNYYNYVTNFDNPIVAFGATAGQSPLYVGQEFQFGVYCGFQYESTNGLGTNFAAPLRLLIYNLSSFTNGQTNLIAPIATNYITIPRQTIDTNWWQFVTNGFSMTTNSYGLQTTVKAVIEPGGVWGTVPEFTNAQDGAWLITQECTTNMGYGYVVEGLGTVPLSTNLYPMVTNSTGLAWDRLYSMDFETRPPWLSTLITEPQFNGTPMPSFYQGASLSELTNLDAVLTNSIPLTGSVYTTVNDSPELLDNPTLDQAVANLNDDPIAIANYVLNNIHLTDALSYNPNNGQASAPTVNEGGVDRSAYDVYMEGEGSPVEQCALLVYMLRQAGYPAAYVFPTNNNVQMLDTRLSALLRMQLHGAVNQYGQLYTTNTLITVNYPWVVTTISNKTVQIFPWLKDTEITEGLNLYNYMPTNYSSGFLWLQHYIYADTNILDLNPESDEPAVLFPEFVNEQLLTNAPGISLDDIGVTAVDRQNYYTSWSDFPTPTVVNNPAQVAVVDCLSSSAITNVSPTMTNIFNTVTLTIYSQQNTNESMTIGPLRMADLHNREMFMATNGADGMTLWLAPYLSSNTNQSSFSSSDPLMTNIQTATLTITTNDSGFDIVMTHNRDLSINFTPSSDQYLSISDSLVFSTPARPFNLQDVTAICFNVGTVTPAMMNVHAQAFQQMTYQWSLNTNTIPAVSAYQAAAAYMMGMDYYSHVSSFLPVCEQLHKVQVVSWYAEGLSRLTPVQLGAQQFMRPSLDMFYSEMAHAGNGTSHPDSGSDTAAGTDDFTSIMDGEIAAEEHGIINGYYQSENTVSSIVLLRLAQQNTTNGDSGIIELNENNYQSIGATNATGYGDTALENYDSTIWAAVTNAFQGWDAPYVRAYITPGPVAVDAANYRGMGLVIIGPGESASIISVNMNGALGPQSSYFGSTAASLSTAYSSSLPADSFTASADLDESAIYGSSAYGGDLYYGGSALGGDDFDYYWSTPDWFDGGLGFIPYENPVAEYQVTATFTPPSQVNLAQQINDLYDLPQSTPVTTSLIHELNSGNTGTPTWKNVVNYVAEPVNVMSGEFYQDIVDLTVAGPQPLQVRRNYSSQNQSDLNGFGYGWNINIVPYITIATNTTATTTNVVLTAVELDGSVIAYQQQSSNSNLFLPTLSGNPQLDNFGGGHIGSINNPFNASVIHSFSGTNELYTLTQANGQIRTYIVNSFPVVTATNTISRQRPYLATWQDTQGNSWAFDYDSNTNDPAYGSVIRIKASNGNYLGFDYNAAGYVIDAYTSDGEETYYQYDDFGDMVGVTRADGTQETYQYQHIQYTNNGTTYLDSAHLLVFDLKPDGRTLENVYDNQRRVTNQLATCGSDLNLYTNATFSYFNNFNITNAYTNHISGYTLVKDVNGNNIRYDYTNSLVTTNTDELGHQIIQSWYADNATSPGFPRSPYQIRDKRGLWTQFQYDQYGNVTNSFSWGDLTGSGTTVYATNTANYNSNNLPVQITDPIGNSIQTVYSAQYPYLPQYVIFAPSGTPTVTNQFSYGNTTNVVVNGNLTLTNTAFGLLQQEISAVNSSDAATDQWSFDGRGYITQQVQFTGTGDPAVTNYFVCDNQGEIVQRTDAAGQTTTFAYDDMHRPTAHEVFAAGQSLPLFSEFFYYNDNGEINWYQGPRYNPANYEYFDYDGDGRLTTQIHWRSQANTNGTGMTAPSGDNVYAQTFNLYDKFGDLTLSVDPRTAMVTNKWDAVGQLLQRQHLDTNGTTILSTEQFGHEPGGLVNAYTNPLAGVTLITYTTTGQPEYQTNADGSTNGWRYYLDGRIQEKIQSNGAYWQIAYDDVDRIITSIFCSPSGVPEATNSIQLDRRGNVIQQADAGFNIFTTAYDGLNRVKSAAGPAIVTVDDETLGMAPPLTNTYVTNVLQQSFTNYFDAAGQVLTNVNALGETTVTYFDALYRPTEVQIFSSTGTLVRQRTWAYSADFNNVTITDGTGANAISRTIYTDNDNQPVLDIAYPLSGTNEFVLNQYDLDENPISQQHSSLTTGGLTTWTTASFTFDGLGRVTSKTDRDNALTTYSYNPMSEITNIVLPGGVLKWNATYNNAGQLLKDFEASGTVGTRTNTYSYFAPGNPDAGLLQTNTDGRGVSCVYSYDDWLRTTNMIYSGSRPEQNMTTAWQYEPRGYITSITEQFTNASIGPATTITFAHDPYGQLSSESVSDGSFGYDTGQTWDASGRRTMLTFGDDADYSFGWQADGHLTYASDETGSGYYSFDASGILTSRIVGNRETSITSRDGEGRPLSIATTVNILTNLIESLAYSGDGLLTADTLDDPDFTDSRSYTYANLSRRLTQEQLNLNDSTTWTNSFVYDQGASGGLGVLTTMGQVGQSSGLWSGAPDAFSRVNIETNNSFSYSAYGHVNGQATLSAWLDGNYIPIMGLGTNAMQWRATMDLSHGTHELEVAALHPSGFYTAWATNFFTNNIPYQPATNIFDYAGYVTNRVWKDTNGTVYQTQSLSWDAHGRLYSVIDRDINNSGYNWMAVYDALGRRLSTTTVLVTNGVTYPASSETFNSYFDPEVEFLEVGVQQGDFVTWKLYGPDLDGTYGGENGTGGLDGVSPYLDLFDPVISDARGDILAEETNGIASWNPSRPTGYGAVPDYRPASFGNGADLAQASAWRGREVDITGFYNLGARMYDPIAGNWLSFDPVWNAVDPEGYTFCSGDPIDLFDPSGRVSKGTLQAQWQNVNVGADWAADQIVNALTGIGYLANQGAYLVTGEPGFAANAQAFQSEMSPFARQGYYNPNTPNAQLATAATMLVNPQSAAGRLGSVESTVTRNVVPAITTESIQAETAAVQNGVANSSTRLLAAPPQQLILSASRQPVALLPENAASLTLRNLPNPYVGVQRASQYLQAMGISRAQRVQWLQSFNAGTMNVRMAGASEFGLRYYDNVTAFSQGRFLFETFPASRQSLALPLGWNQMSSLAQWQIRPGAIILEGEAALQGIGLEGGQWQKFVLNPQQDLLQP